MRLNICEAERGRGPDPVVRNKRRARGDAFYFRLPTQARRDDLIGTPERQPFVEIGKGHNRRVQQGSCVLHGEMDALENAGRQPASLYRESTIYTTLSPCSMCSGAILLYGICTVVVGENRTFMGEEALLRSKGVDVTVLQDRDCIKMMRQFIQEKPGLWDEDIGV